MTDKHARTAAGRRVVFSVASKGNTEVPTTALLDYWGERIAEVEFEAVQELERAASHVYQAWHHDLPTNAPELHETVYELALALDQVSGRGGDHAKGAHRSGEPEELEPSDLRTPAHARHFSPRSEAGGHPGHYMPCFPGCIHWDPIVTTPDGKQMPESETFTDGSKTVRP